MNSVYFDRYTVCERIQDLGRSGQARELALLIALSLRMNLLGRLASVGRVASRMSTHLRAAQTKRQAQGNQASALTSG
jgi:hypothetical protein